MGHSLGFSLSTPPSAPGAEALTLDLATVEALHANAATRGVPAGTVFKYPGIDTLPAGASLAGDTITVTGAGVSFSGWNFLGYKFVLEGTGTTFDACAFGFDATKPADWAFFYIDAYATAQITRIRYCSFIGAGYFGGAGDAIAIRARTSGTGAAMTAARFDLIERCEFFGWGTDMLKPAHSGVIRLNYFDAPINAPTGTAAWSAGTTYNTGDLVFDTGVPYRYMYRSLSDGNTGNALPVAKSDNTFWENVDPHVDSINPYAQVDTTEPLIIEGNFINRSEAIRALDPGAMRGVGMNNGIRAWRNAQGGQDTPHHTMICRHNVVTVGTPTNISYPLALEPFTGLDPLTSPDSFTDNWVSQNDSSQILIPGEDLGNTVSGNDQAYVTTSVPAAGYTGPDLTRPGAAPSLLTITAPDLPVYDSDAHGTGLAALPLSGTHDSDWSSLEYRVIRVSDGGTVVDWTGFTAGAGGQWSVTAQVAPSMEALRAEVRAVDAPAVSALQTGECFAGYIVGYMGQSLARRPILENFAATFTPPAKTMWCLFNDLGGTWLANGVEEVTASSTLGLRRMAAVVAQHSDAPVLLVDMTESGTARTWAADSTETGRDWATTIADPVAYIRARGSDLSILFEAWFTGDAGTFSDFERHFAPFYLRRQVDGLADVGDASGVQDYVTGTTVAAVPSRAYEADHHLWDLSAAGDAGLLDPVRTKWVPGFGSVHVNRTSPVLDGEITTNDSQKGALRAALLSISETSSAFDPVTLSSVAGWSGQEAFGGHVVMPAETHVASQDADGESLAAANYMLAILRGLGQLGTSEPRITGASWATDGSHVDVTVSLPHGGTLSTAFIEEAAGSYAGSFEATEWTAPSTTPAALRELHEVQGFSLVQGGSRIFGDFTATIQDANAGIIRVTPATPFANGDTLSFGYGDGLHLLNIGDITASRPHLRMPLETRPHVSGTGYGYGVLKASGEAALFTAAGIAAGGAFATKGAASDAYLTGPTHPSGVTGMTVEFDAHIGIGTISGFDLINHSGTSFRVLLDTRSGRRGVRFNMKDGTATAVFNSTGSVNAGDFPATRGTFILSCTQDRGDGTAEFKTYWDGVEQQSFTAPAGATPSFQTNRSLEILDDDGAACDLYSVRVWHAYTSDGSTAGLGSPVHEVAGMAVNWNTPGTGLSKAGTSDFT